ncbi:hypothetical protein G9A89_016367 [Geosiphon pyriformis]|nr:hypothetical protein G9A89_016367 [Geosiphon pyriformis]
MHICHNCKSICTSLHPNDTTANLLTTNISSFNLSTGNTCNLSATATIYLLTTNLETRYAQNLNFQHYLSLLVTPEDALLNNQKLNQNKLLTSNIPPATITNDKLLAAIFLFEFEKLSFTPLFSGVMLEEKLITTMYTNAKVDGHPIKFILDNHQVDNTASARIITADKVTKIPIGKIDNFLIKVNGIIVPIKVLVMKATQY